MCKCNRIESIRFILRQTNHDFIKIPTKVLLFVHARFQLLNLLANVFIVFNERLLNALQKFLVACNSFQNYRLAFLQFSEEFAKICS